MLLSLQMAANSRFAVATHLMMGLALEAKGPVPSSSEFLAKSVNTSPIVVRRILGMLRDAGLVVGHPGRHGGATLAKAPDSVTLLDVYRAVDESSVFAFNTNRPNQHCPLSCSMKALLVPIFEGVESAVEDELRAVRLSDLVEKLLDETAGSPIRSPRASPLKRNTKKERSS